LEDQALNNAANAARNPLAIPAQIRLVNSVTSAVNTVNAGIAPDIALRAIAVTGVALSSTNSVTQNWSANPISGYLDLKRLQVFYSYAVHESRQTFDQFEAQLNKLGEYKAEQTPAPPDAGPGTAAGHAAPAKPAPKPPPLSVQIGRLPPSGFIRVNDPDHCPGGVERTLYSPPFDRVCFPPKQKVDGSDTEIAPDSLLSLFVLWSVAIPDLSQTDDKSQRGASPNGVNNLVISVPTQ
jgi:hypothetical protein